MVLKYPLTGVGFGQFSENMLAYAVNPVERRGRVAHNSYIHVVAEIGIPGFIAFMMLFYLSFRGSLRMARVVKQRPEGLQDIVKIGVLPCNVATWIPAFFLSVGYSNILLVQFAFVAACMNVFNVNSEPSPLSQPPATT